MRSHARCCFFPSPSSSVLPHLPAPFLLISALSFCVHPPFLAHSLFSTWGPGIRKLSEGREAWWPGVTGVTADGGPRGPLPPPAVNDSNPSTAAKSHIIRSAHEVASNCEGQEIEENRFGPRTSGGPIPNTPMCLNGGHRGGGLWAFGAARGADERVPSVPGNQKPEREREEADRSAVLG